MKFRSYAVTLKSDGGKVKIRTVARSKKQAGRIVCINERAPQRAICKVKYLKTI